MDSSYCKVVSKSQITLVLFLKLIFFILHITTIQFMSALSIASMTVN